MKKTDPLYKIAAAIAALAVIIAAFSAIFIYGGEIGLPGAEAAALTNADAPERSENASGEDDSEAPDYAPSPSAAASALPSPTPEPDAVGFNEEFTGVYDVLLEFAETEGMGYAEYGLIKSQNPGIKYKAYEGEVEFSEHEWQFSIDLDRPMLHGPINNFSAGYHPESHDADMMARAFADWFAFLSAQYGEPVMFSVADGENDAEYEEKEASGTLTPEDASRAFHSGGEEAYAFARWEATIAGRPANVELQINCPPDWASMGIDIWYRLSAGETSTLQAEPGPSPSPSRSPARSPSPSSAPTAPRSSAPPASRSSAPAASQPSAPAAARPSAPTASLSPASPASRLPAPTAYRFTPPTPSPSPAPTASPSPAPTPTPPPAPAPNAPQDGSGGTNTDVIDDLLENARGGTAGDSIGSSVSLEFGGDSWLFSEVIADGEDGFTMKHYSGGGHAAGAIAFTDGLEYFSGRYGEPVAIGGQGADPTQVYDTGAYLESFRYGVPHNIYAFWRFIPSQRNWVLWLKVDFEDDGGYSIEITVEEE